MNNEKLTLIEASAGTGKTYTLAETVLRMIQKEGQDSGRMLITTFTEKAAEELQVRVRQKLVDAGMKDAARSLPLSRIGTVHSLCESFIREYAYELGLSPAVSVAPPDWQAETLSACMAEAATHAQSQQLAEWTQRLSGMDAFTGTVQWEQDLEGIVNLARSNGIRDLKKSRKQSLDALQQRLPKPDSGLEKGMMNAIPDLATVAKTNQKLLKPFSNGNWTWADWHRAWDKLPPTVYPDLKELMGEFHRHPQFQKDVCEMCTTLFDLAKKTLQLYQAKKDALGLIDFIDMELHMRELLKLSPFLSDLGARYNLLLVDEFQDTNPMQLDLFMKLGAAMDKVFWVGDPKQSIYGFRGADPALMGQVLKHMDLVKHDPLDTSWRSREDICAFVSRTFTTPYKKLLGMEERNVHMCSAYTEEPEECGSAVEGWTLTGNKAVRAGQIAEGVRKILTEDGGDLWVPKEKTSACRQTRPQDVAVLCRSHYDAADVAGALRAEGLSVAYATGGLTETPEGALCRAALRYWADPSDRLARAELERMPLHSMEEQNTWLSQLLGEDVPPPTGLAELVDTLRAGHRAASPEQAFLLIREHLPWNHLCHQWGSPDSAQANLDRFLGHIVEFQALCRQCQQAVTLPGFLLHLEKKAKAGEDKVGHPGTASIHVGTLHGAKGLEWPVVILFGWEQVKTSSPFQARVETPETFSVEQPLLGRWIRYWPNPLTSCKIDSPFAQRFSEEFTYEQDRADREWLNLAYVGMTRAASRLVLTGQKPNAVTGLDLQDLEWQPPPQTGTEAPECGPTSVSIPVFPLRTEENPPAVLNPSKIETAGTVEASETMGGRLSLSGTVEDSKLGNMLHAWFASELKRSGDASVHLSHWGLTDNLESGDLQTMADRLKNWLEARWPGASLEVEVPFQFQDESGSLCRGSIDLVVETETGMIVVDHKSYQGRDFQENAAGHAGQLQAYADALTRSTDLPVLETWIHFPMQGRACRVRPLSTVPHQPKKPS